MDNQVIIDALHQSELFKGLSENALGQIASHAKIRQFFPHETIVWQGEPSTSLFLIINGIVAVKNVTGEKESHLAYLISGNTFGEVGILENTPRSATVSALSEVDVLVIRRDDFLNILHQYASVAIELARILARYLVQSSRRLSSEAKDTKIILLFDSLERDGGTSISALLAEMLSKTQKRGTALFEYPNPYRILGGFQLQKGATIFHHPAGYDILLPQEDKFLPASTRVTLLLDRIRNLYDIIVIQVRDMVDEGVVRMLEDAKQIILLAPPSKQGFKRIARLKKQLKGRIQPEETSVMTLINRCKPAYQDVEFTEDVDWEIPFLNDFPTFKLPYREEERIPEPLRAVLEGCVERLERTHSIGIFIPTTTDANTQTDTTSIMDETLAFMAERFGGATCKVANGVWHSEKLGLIGEVVYIVHSYITQADMNRYLDEIVEYIKRLKRELKQEAMALEVNHKLTLI